MKNQIEKTLPPGTGYFDCTRYPLGGKFCRVPRDDPKGMIILDIKLIPFCKGIDAIGKTKDNRSVAFKEEHLKGDKS